MLLACQLGISYTICVISRDYFGNPLDVPKFSVALIKECEDFSRCRRRRRTAAAPRPATFCRPLPFYPSAERGPWA